MRTFFAAGLAILVCSPVAFGADKSKPAALQVEPSRLVLKGKGARQALLVMGRFADGGLRDVTARAQYKSLNSKVAKVGKTGIITPVADGVTTVTVSFPGLNSKGRINVAVSVEDSRTAPSSFVNNVQPALGKLGCNATACHGAKVGKGGLKLSLFGGDLEADYDALTKAAAGRRINRVEPLKSLLLEKATGRIPHQGGDKLKAGTAEYDMVTAWLAKGTPWTDEKEPKIVALKVSPSERVLKPDEAQQLLVSAVFSDGFQRDATLDSVYRSSDPKIVAITADGKIKAAGYGEAYIVVNYLRKAAVARITIPQTGAPFPKLEANNRIDDLVYAKLRTLGIPPSGDSGDQEFLRRVYLDVIGILPTAAEARAFLADQDSQRRSKLIDRLLEREEFADFWALKWGDLLRIKSEYPVRVWPKAVAVYYRWVHESIARNKPYDQFVTELLTSSGSNFRSAPANFYRAMQNKDPQTIGETTALIFMGARIGCARCHGHPTESWALGDDVGLGAFFSKVSFKSTLEWKEEIVYSSPRATFRNPKTREIAQPRFPGGEAPVVEREEDPRWKFAAWLTAPRNPWFAKNIVNRIWYWLLDRGIIHEPDDVRPTNPPENPELLAYLETELTGRKYDLKHIYRLILNSRTYQRSSTPNQWNAKDTTHFSHYMVKRLSAEQLLDAVSQVTETSEKFRSIIPEPFSNWPAGYRATQISDGNTECSFLDMFGRPPRDTPYEEERSSELSLRQALYFINSEQLAGKVANSPSIKRLMQNVKGDKETVDELYLTTLARLPKDEESKKLVAYLVKNKNARPQAVQDVVWAVMNTKEFLFNH